MGANKYINLQQRQRASKNTENKKNAKINYLTKQTRR